MKETSGVVGPSPERGVEVEENQGQAEEGHALTGNSFLMQGCRLL